MEDGTLPWHYTKPSSSRPEVLCHGCSPAVRAALFSSHRWQSCSKSRVPAAQKRKQFFLLLNISRRECIRPLDLMLPEGSLQARTTSRIYRAGVEGQQRHQKPSECNNFPIKKKPKTIKHKDPSTPSSFFISFLAGYNCAALHSSIHLCAPHPTLRHSGTSLQPDKMFSFLATLCCSRRLPGPTRPFPLSPLSSWCVLQPDPAHRTLQELISAALWFQPGSLWDAATVGQKGCTALSVQLMTAGGEDHEGLSTKGRK